MFENLEIYTFNLLQVEENVNVETVDPYVNCEKNLLHHIIKMQSVLDERLDLIEEQVSGKKIRENTNWYSATCVF